MAQRVIGAIAVSGSPGLDEAFARVGLEKIQETLSLSRDQCLAAGGTIDVSRSLQVLRTRSVDQSRLN